LRDSADWSKFIPSQNKFLATPLEREEGERGRGEAGQEEKEERGE